MMTLPAGYELVHRSAIVRLGPTWGLHDETNHASLGIVDVRLDGTYLLVETDFDDASGELILSATAHVDATLAAKGVFAGCSGGSSITKIAIYSCRNLPYGSGSVRAAFTMLPPQSSVFDSTVDNLWIDFVSMRPV